ncbi:MAG: diguanylate cyclase [Acidobacteriota bacterium]
MDGAWLEELEAAVTITTVDGTIVGMNEAARRTFAAEGGAALIGSSVFDCHPEPAKTRTRELFAERTPNHYTVEKAGVTKIIHQMPWFRNGEFAGFVEIAVPIPARLPHFQRG